MTSKAVTKTKPIESDDVWDDEDDLWQEMEVVKRDEPTYDLDEEEQKKYHYVSPKRATTGGNATGVFDDYDAHGQEWRSKQDQNENDYTRLRLNEDDDTEEIHLRTKFLFDEDKAMTPLSQMQATKNLLTEAQRIAYVGVCYLTCREMGVALRKVGRKELQPAIKNLELWSLKIMGRLYYHMEIATAEQKMIQSLAEHGVNAMDLVPPLMTTHTVANPEYDPAEAQRAAEEQEAEDVDGGQEAAVPVGLNDMSEPSQARTRSNVRLQTTANVLDPSTPVAVPGVSTHLSSIDKDVTLDIRWTVLCDLFLILIADSVYDARSRVLLETVASKLGLGWSEVVKFEKRVTDALEIEEGTETLDNTGIVENRAKAARKRRIIMLGLATLGGGLVIGLSAGVMAPIIGSGIVATLATLGVTGGGAAVIGTAGGAAVITATGALTGGSIAVRGMARRTRHVRTFEILPLHNNKRVSCILTVPGFMSSVNDDVRLPFSVLDPMVGDVFSVRWEPEMMGEMGNALKILSTEVLSQVGTTVLQFTVLTTLMTALSWPMLLTKLGYLIDNPWSNALDRAKAAGQVLADVLVNRTLGVRPMTLIGFSLGARMIFYCLQELAKRKAYGIVQDVFLLGATVTAPVRTWVECRSVVAGRFVNGFARNDWILGYLFRATSGGLNTVAGMRPVDNVPGLENVDLTDKIAGHTSYRSYMPLILDQLGFPVSADYFDEPEEMDIEDREIAREAIEEGKAKKSFSLLGRGKVSTPSRSSSDLLPARKSTSSAKADGDDELPERLSSDRNKATPGLPVATDGEGSTQEMAKVKEEEVKVPLTAGFDLKALASAVAEVNENVAAKELQMPAQHLLRNPPLPERTESAPQLKLISMSKALPPSPSTPTAPTPYRTTHFSHSNPGLAGADESDDSDLPKRFNDMRFQEDRSTTPMSHKFPNSTSPTSISSIKSPYGEYTYARQDPFGAMPTASSQYADTPTLSFGGADGSVWTPTPTTAGTFNTVASAPIDTYSSKPFGASTNGSNVNLNKGYGIASTSPSNTSNPFGSNVYSPNPFAASSTLSFGDKDGSISLGSTGLERDPWAPKPIAGSKKPAYAVNPWES